ncbi:hypothetical protein LBBP_02223 [Leptospira borgpetersenii serovar Ballum]|uniref:Uncharacterized protein n=1 Tax=Leptospira borgpetersenii serovar Ballum TaxID=280505 RepID=A0A0S2ISP2_LEPBO|nr:hypothetical protein LBBP_02223 [Leptospira borgpetersenii serovar Ballum]
MRVWEYFERIVFGDCPFHFSLLRDKFLYDYRTLLYNSKFSFNLEAE